MKSSDIRSRFLEFFRKREHTVIKSASLVTSDEKGITNPTLFNTAGMQPLIPYLLGKPYEVDGKSVKRLVNVQKCLRTVDIDDVGDATHATFFEMLGNWSLGDYFKEDAIKWSYEFLTSKEEGLGLEPKRLYVSVFAGDDNAPKDEEAANIWREIFKKNGIEGNRIFYLPADKNWWQAGENGPCGPDTEMYYDVANTYGGRGLNHDEFVKADDERKVVEIWNDVFMQFEKKDGKIVGSIPKPSVDTGAGLERLAMTMQGVDNIYDTDLFVAAIKKISELSNKDLKNSSHLKSARIVADHIRASVFLIADGVTPANTDRGYVLRKLIRRAVRHADILGMGENGTLDKVADVFIKEVYREVYPEVFERRSLIVGEIMQEEKRFHETLIRGLVKIEKILSLVNLSKQPFSSDSSDIIRRLSGKEAFDLYQSDGFPLELIIEIAKEKGITVDVDRFETEFKKHQELSRTGAEQKFKGGLADANDPMVVRYHTATHLLHQALFDVLGEKVMQKGSNITAERLRFDFAHDAKMTDEQKKKVEAIINEKISQALPVNKVIMPKSEAEKTGARHFFGEKYDDEVSIYFIGNDLATAYSKEFCGGPHISNTRELAGPEGKWHFKIQKEEALAKGVRRIKATLE